MESDIPGRQRFDIDRPQCPGCSTSAGANFPAGMALMTLLRVEGGPVAYTLGTYQPVAMSRPYNLKHRAFGLFWMTNVFYSLWW